MVIVDPTPRPDISFGPEGPVVVYEGPGPLVPNNYFNDPGFMFQDLSRDPNYVNVNREGASLIKNVYGHYLGALQDAYDRMRYSTTQGAFNHEKQVFEYYLKKVNSLREQYRGYFVPFAGLRRRYDVRRRRRRYRRRYFY